MSDIERMTPEEAAEMYRRKLIDAKSQIGAEDWFAVHRDGDAELEARPIDRQDDREEGERITSDKWLIREPTGETYTVSEHTFESEFEDANQFTTRRFMIDLSWDAVDEDDPTVPTIPSSECHVYVDAKIHVPSDSIVSMDVVGTEQPVDGDDGEMYDALPMEMVYDSDRVSDVEDEEA